MIGRFRFAPRLVRILPFPVVSSRVLTERTPCLLRQFTTACDWTRQPGWIANPPSPVRIREGPVPSHPFSPSTSLLPHDAPAERYTDSLCFVPVVSDLRGFPMDR